MPDTDTIEVVIVERREEADGIASLQLALPGGGALPSFEAGAHVDIHIEPGLVRQYSLCNDPRQRDRYVLGVLREPSSRGGSATVHEQFHAGRGIRIGVPRNNFHLKEDGAHSILVGGGIGITPLMAMAWRLHALGASFEMHYCTRSLKRTAFREVLATAPFADRVRLHVDEGPTEQRFAVESVLRSSAPGARLYLCGPAGFIAHVTDVAGRSGWDASRIHVEHFSAQVSTGGEGFSVRTARSGRHFNVAPDQTLAQALLANGVNIPLSCEQGVCGTCVVGVLEGISDHRDMCLLPEEQASNKLMMPCCSRSTTPVLVLDL